MCAESSLSFRKQEGKSLMRHHTFISNSLARSAALALLAVSLPQFAEAQAARHPRPLDAGRYFRRLRGGINGHVDWSMYDRARAQIALMAPAGGGAKNGGPIAMAAPLPLPNPVASSAWSFLGPVNDIDTSVNAPIGQGPGAVAGRVNACTYDPHNAKVFYVATSSGGVWRTADNGATWTCLSLADTYGRSFSCVTVDPNDSTTVYAGSGDYDNPGSFPASFGFGIIKFKFASN